MVEIMHSNIPYSNTSYNKDITELVCPLVTPEKLQKMMQDKYAKKHIKYFDKPGRLGKEGDIEWWITLEVLLGKKTSFPSELILVIIINQNDGECRARIHQYIFGT